MEQFQIKLKNDRKKSYDSIALFILIINTAIAVFFIINPAVFRVFTKNNGLLLWIAIMIVLAIFYFIAKKKFIVTVQEDLIRYPSFPEKNISWNDITGIVLKDGLLTIDFKNNKLIQQYVDESDLVNEGKFNEFCKNILLNDKKQIAKIK